MTYPWNTTTTYKMLSLEIKSAKKKQKQTNNNNKQTNKQMEPAGILTSEAEAAWHISLLFQATWPLNKCGSVFFFGRASVACRVQFAGVLRMLQCTNQSLCSEQASPHMEIITIPSTSLEPKSEFAWYNPKAGFGISFFFFRLALSGQRSTNLVTRQRF